MQLIEQHFEAAFAAPDGIKKLRELILTLAMQGKLVPQDSKDQPASELLKQIEAEKKRLLKEGIIKQPNSPSPLALSEMPYALPQSWEWTRLENITTKIHYGFTASANPSVSEVRLLRITDIQNNAVDWDSVPGCDAKRTEVEQYLLNEGDILIARTGGTIGKSYLVLGLHLDAVFASYLIRAIPSSNVSVHFLKRFLECPLYWQQLYAASSGTGQPNVNGTSLSRLILPLPPVAEQGRIVSKVDELMARCDALEKLRQEREAKRLAVHTAAVHKLLNVASAEDHNEAREFLNQHFGELYTVKENVAELRNAILQLAVMGKLVPQDPNDPPASELLKQIEAEKKRLVKEGKIRAPKSLPPLPANEAPFKLPAGWAWARFSHFATEIATGPFGSMIHQSDYISGGVPLINPSHMIDGRIVYDPEVSIPPGIAEDLQSYRLHRDDIVMARRGEMGRCAIVTSAEDGFLCGTGSFILRFVSEVDRRFILNFFRTEYCREHLGGNSVGTTMTNLNQGILEAMPIPIAPAKEQRRIVAEISQMMSLCDALEQQIDAAREKQSALLNATMAQIGGQRCA